MVRTLTLSNVFIDIVILPPSLPLPLLLLSESSWSSILIDGVVALGVPLT
jgi:hypothetical protein